MRMMISRDDEREMVAVFVVSHGSNMQAMALKSLPLNIVGIPAMRNQTTTR